MHFNFFELILKKIKEKNTFYELLLTSVNNVMFDMLDIRHVLKELNKIRSNGFNTKFFTCYHICKPF